MSDSDSDSNLSNLSTFSSSDFDAYESRSFHFLQTARLLNPDGTYRCPFCVNARSKQFLPLHSLLRHASSLSSPSSSSSRRRRPSSRAAHLALFRFLQPAHPLPANPIPQPDILFFPWSALLLNVPLRHPLRQTLTPFNPTHLIPFLISPESDSPCGVVVRFRNNWEGFRDALCFENRFKAEGFGREGWAKGKRSGVYGWMAREEDFLGEGVLGEYLRRNGKVVTVKEVEKEEGMESEKMVELLAGQIAVRNRCLEDLKGRFSEEEFALRRMEEERDLVHRSFNEKMQRAQIEARENAVRVLEENERLRLELEAKRKEVDLRSRQVHMLGSINFGKRKRLGVGKQQIVLASMEQKQADEDAWKLVEEQKMEKEAAIMKILQLEKQLNQREQLELEIKQLKGKLLKLKHLGEEDTGLPMKMKKVEELLVAGKAKLEVLMKKERNSNDELQEARKLLIKGFDELLKGDTIIGIKRMGQLDEMPFRNVCKKKFCNEDADIRALELCSSWQEELKKPSWHPFRILESGGRTEEVIDDNDEKLKQIRIDFGFDVYKAVKTALLEINEYNPSGRYVVPELWNFEENRKATMKEAVQYLAKQCRILKSRR